MLTSQQRRAFDELVAAYSALHHELLAEYDRDLSYPGYLGHQVLHRRDRLMLGDQAIAGVRTESPSESVQSIAPLVYAMAAYAGELLHPLHMRIAQRYSGYMGSLFIVGRIRDFRQSLATVLAFPGMDAAIRRHGNLLRERARGRAQAPITEYVVPGHPRILIGEVVGPHQVVRLEHGGRVIAENIEDGREVSFTIPQWISHRQNVQIYRSVLGRLQANAILQFGMGFAEGLGQQVQGTIEMFAHLRQALEGLARLIRNLPTQLRALANQVLEAILQWARDFAGASTPHRARMAGRLLGALFLEIVSEVVTGGAAAALRGILGGLRGVRGLAGVFRVVDRVGNAAGLARRVTGRALSGAARQVLARHRLLVRSLYRSYLRAGFIVAEAVLEVAGEFVEGTIRRIAQAGETVFVFVVEGGEELMVRLGRQLELPADLAVFPRGSICARP